MWCVFRMGLIRSLNSYTFWWRFHFIRITAFSRKKNSFFQICFSDLALNESDKSPWSRYVRMYHTEQLYASQNTKFVQQNNLTLAFLDVMQCAHWVKTSHCQATEKFRLIHVFHFHSFINVCFRGTGYPFTSFAPTPKRMFKICFPLSLIAITTTITISSGSSTISEWRQWLSHTFSHSGVFDNGIKADTAFVQTFTSNTRKCSQRNSTEIVRMPEMTPTCSSNSVFCRCFWFHQAVRIKMEISHSLSLCVVFHFEHLKFRSRKHAAFSEFNHISLHKAIAAADVSSIS